MSLLASASDLHPLFSSVDFYPQLFKVIENSLLQQQDNEPGVVSWIAFPMVQEDQHINIHALCECLLKKS
jgi:hypothetical protein